MAARGCGAGRVAGGLYAVCGGGTTPLEEFLFCPPVLPPANMRIAARGVTLFQHGGIWHIADHIGSEHYPNVADYVEELRRLGLSRRIPTNLDFTLLTRGKSRIVLLHSRAYLRNYRDLQVSDPYPRACPKHIPGHATEEDAAAVRLTRKMIPISASGLPDTRRWQRLGELAISGDPAWRTEFLPGMCIGGWWTDLDPESLLAEECPDEERTGRKEVRRRLAFYDPATADIEDRGHSYGYYTGRIRPVVPEPDYAEAIFASFPFRFEIVDGPGAPETAAKARQSGLATDVVAE
jgi:hypothetical protein